MGWFGRDGRMILRIENKYVRKQMKRLITTLSFMVLAASAQGQLIGLPVGIGAASAETGTLQASGGVVLGDNYNMYGVRGSYTPMDRLTLQGDFGLIDQDTSGIDMAFSIQGTALYSLPLDLPVDLALRASLGFASAEISGGGDVNWTSLSGGAIASKTFDKLTPYGYLGLHYLKGVVKWGNSEASDDDLEPAIGAGLAYELNDHVRLYAELIHADDFFVAFGGGYRF
jgi:hypothetical protein